MNFDIGEILSRASQITWNNKVLWMFNVFPVLFSFLFVPIVFIPMFFIGPYSLVNQSSVDQSYYVSLFGTIDFFLIALSILLYTVGSASSSLGILRVENGRKELPFRDLLQDGLEYFWRFLGITLLIGGTATVVLLMMIGGVVLLGLVTRGLGMILLPPLFFMLYPAMLLAYSMIEQSQAAVVTENMGAHRAISRGWALLKAHFWSFVRFSLVIYFGMFLLGLIVTLPLIVPFLLFPLVLEGPQAGLNFQRFGWTLIGLSLVLLPILALVQGVAMTFIKAAFMAIYLRLTRSTVQQTALQ